MADKQGGNKRKHMLIGLGSFFALVGAGYAFYWLGYGQYFQSTEDAYVTGNLIQLMPQVTGNVVSVGADETDRVKAGQTLVALDATDAKIALEKSETDLAQTVRKVKQLYENADALKSDVNARTAELEKALSDLARRKSLISAHAVSHEELQHAEDGASQAKAALEGAKHRYEAALASVRNTSLGNHPEVLSAETRLREAWLALHRTRIASPAGGYVAKRSVQVGQRVTPASTLMVIVPLDQIWVDANFKEDQLGRIRIGQPVSMTSDIYGRKVVFHGKVAGIGAGTGSVFSLLPPQNATGNWIKVIQRLPVRIALDPKEIAGNPLRIGLSMVVTVDTHDESGQVLETANRAGPAYSTGIFENSPGEADGIILNILKANE